MGNHVLFVPPFISNVGPRPFVELIRDKWSAITPVSLCDPVITAGSIHLHLEGHAEAGTITAAS